MSEAPAAVRRFRWLAIVAFALFGLLAIAAVGGTAWVAAARRAELIRFATSGSIDYSIYTRGMGYLRFTTLAATLALLSWPALAAVLLYLWVKEVKDGLRRSLPALVVGLVPLSALLTLAACTVWHNLHLPWLGHLGENLSYAEAQALRYKLMLDGLGMPSSAWLATVIAAAVVAVVGAATVNLVPRALTTSRYQHVISGAILALGLAAFAATRAHAHDAARPIPLWRQENYSPRIEAPTIASCDRDSVALEAIVIEIAASGQARLDGEAHTPSELATNIRRKRELWQQLNPGRPAPTRIILALAPALDPARVDPIVAIARAEGYTDVYEARLLPARTWQSRTLGAVPFQPRGCAVPLGH